MLTKEDRINILVETLSVKAEEGLLALEKLNVSSEEFTVCLNNTLTCYDLLNKLTYVPEKKQN